MANAIMVAAAASTSDIAMVVHLQCALVLPRSNAPLHIIDCQSVKMQCATVHRDAPALPRNNVAVFGLVYGPSSSVTTGAPGRAVFDEGRVLLRLRKALVYLAGHQLIEHSVPART